MTFSMLLWNHICFIENQLDLYFIVYYKTYAQWSQRNLGLVQYVLHSILEHTLFFTFTCILEHRNKRKKALVYFY